MQSLSLRDPHVIGTLAASVLCIAGGAVFFLFRRRPTPEELERNRRADLVRTGRIIDGTILDISDSPSEAPSDFLVSPEQARYVLYQYEIGGVAYECSQDISALRDQVRPEDLRLSFPCSVRYDVHRPENSIIVAENWSGIRALRPAAQQTPRTRTTPPAWPLSPGKHDVAG